MTKFVKNGMSVLKLVVIASLTIALVAPVATQAQRASGGPVVQLACKHLDVITQSFLNLHVTFDTMTPKIESRMVEQFVKRLDSAKIYLLQSDVAEIKKMLTGVTKSVKAGKCDAIENAQKLFVKRAEERLDFAKKTLSDKKFKFDPSTTLQLDPDHRQFPKTKAEADKFHQKYIQFQLSNLMVSGLKQDEAQGQLIRTYERNLKRVKDTSQEDLYADYLDSFGRALDPHTAFMSRDVQEDFQIQMGLSLEGIGATLSSQDGFTVVEQLLAGGSAKESGLVQPQDKIIAVGQMKGDDTPGEMESVIDMELRDVVRRIRGPKGTKVRLTILRKTETGTDRQTVTLTRDKIKLEDDAAQLSFVDKEINGQKRKIAVLNLPSFYADGKQRGGRSSAADMKGLLKKAKEAKADGLVLDMSANGGGSLDDAVKIAGLFFKTGNVVKQSARDPAQGELTLDDEDSAVDWGGPMVVLTSRISASASEIVAGTLSDYQRAVIVGGDHTFGKGSVQTVVDLPGGLGALKVTVGMFFTPGGFSTQHRGVTADVVLPGPFSNDEIGEKTLDYSLPPKKLKAFLSPEAYVTEGPGAWQKITAEEIVGLKKNSAARVAKDEDFKKIIAEAKKLAAQGGKILKLSEAQKDGKEKKDEADSKKNLSAQQKEVEYLKRADVREAVNVLGDLMDMQTKQGILIGASKSALGKPDVTKQESEAKDN